MSEFPLGIENKQDDSETAARRDGIDTKFFVRASEFNKLRKGVEEVFDRVEDFNRETSDYGVNLISLTLPSGTSELNITGRTRDLLNALDPPVSTIRDTQISVRYGIGGNVYFQRFDLVPGAGTYGFGATQVQTSDLLYQAPRIFINEDDENDGEPAISIEQSINDGREYDTQIIDLFVRTIDGEKRAFIYDKPSQRYIGGVNPDVLDIDFQEITNSGLDQNDNPPAGVETLPFQVTNPFKGFISLDNFEGKIYRLQSSYDFVGRPNIQVTGQKTLKGKALVPKVDTTGLTEYPKVDGVWRFTISENIDLNLNIGAFTYALPFDTDEDTTVASFVTAQAAQILTDTEIELTGDGDAFELEGYALSVTVTKQSDDTIGLVESGGYPPIQIESPPFEAGKLYDLHVEYRLDNIVFWFVLREGARYFESTGGSNTLDLGEFEGADLAAAKSALETAHPNPVDGSKATVNPIDGDRISAYWDSNATPKAWVYGNIVVGGEVANLRQFNSIEDLKALENTAINDRVITNGYYSNSSLGGALYKRVEPEGLTANDTTIIEGADGSMWELQITGKMNPYMFGAIAYNAGIDNTPALNDFFNYIWNNDVGEAFVDGYFYVGSDLVLGEDIGAQQSSKTLTINGSPTFRKKSGATIDTVFTIINCGNLVWNGIITAYGDGSVDWVNRTVRRGVYISRSGRANFGGFYLRRFFDTGITVDDSIGNTSALYLGNVRGDLCGSTTIGTGKAMVSTFSNPVNSGTVGSGGQRTEIDVVELPPAVVTSVRNHIFCRINGELYNIKNIDRDNNKIQVYPWLDDDFSSGEIKYMFGGVVQIKGSDAGIIGIGLVDAINSTCAVDMMSLYGPNIERVICQSGDTPLIVGLRTDSSMVTYNVGSVYTEGNTYDHLQLTGATSDGGFIINSEYAFRLDKLANLGARAGNVRTNGTSLRNTAFQKSGRWHTYEKKSGNSESGGSAYFFRINQQHQTLMLDRNSWTINLDHIDSLNKAFGFDSATLIFKGTGENNSPTGNFSFKNSDDKLVNGELISSFSNFNGVAIFHIQYNYDSDSFIVSAENIVKYGDTSSRPTGSKPIGFSYFDTTLGYIINYNGTEWVNSSGTIV